jgi:hypothetical protein
MTVLGEGCPGVLDSKEFRTLVIFFCAPFFNELRFQLEKISFDFVLKGCGFQLRRTWGKSMPAFSR